ncbi:MAG: POTRA domain-containing protein [bacterium]
MKRLTLLIVLLVLLLAEGSLTFAQTNNPLSDIKQPCVADGALGRPTLRRRKLAPETPPTDGGTVGQRLLVQQKCEQEDSSADSFNQKPMHFEFDGLQAFTEADMIKAFHERGIGLPKTQMSSSEVLAKAVAIVKERLEERGYFHATVNAREDEQGAIIFLIDEGLRSRLAEVRFEGNRSFSSEELESKTEEYLAEYSQPLAGYDSDIFEFCTRRLLNFIRSRGFLLAAFGQVTKQIDGHGLVLTIPVDEGKLYRLGVIKIEGAQAVAPQKIRAMLTSAQGDIVNGEEIGKWLFENLKRIYGEMGYIEYTAEPEPEFKPAASNPNEGIVDFKVTIDEGRQFRIRRIEVDGANLQEGELLRLLRIRAGEVFNQRLFEESIDELNNLALFEFVDKDRDVDFSTDEEQGLINLVIKLRVAGQTSLNPVD